jgi:hypothetical protein
MYQVNIPDQHAAKMLDWDKPLSEQPENVQAIARQIGAGHAKGPTAVKMQAFVNGKENPQMGIVAKGEDLYRAITDYGGDSAAGSKILADAGIPGIKYLDQGSRPGVRGPWTLITGTGSKLEYGTEEAAKTALQAGLTRGEKLKLIEPPKQTSNFVVFDPAILEDVTRR